MTDKREFGLFIQEKRKESGYSQAELAALLYVSESAVSKWERGITYPDITLITDICKLLNINEHEFLTASNDLEYRKMRRDVKRFYKISNIYFYSLLVIYGIALITCFIVNLAVNHVLSWFFIVLAGILTGFCIFPSFSRFTDNYKLLTVSASFTTSLLLLLLTCNIYTRGNWFLIAMMAIILAFAIILGPIFIKIYPFPKIIKKNNFIVGITIDLLLLILLLLSCVLIYGGNWFLTTAVSLLLAYSIIMTPLIIHRLNVPRLIKNHNALISIGIDYLLLLLLGVVIKISNSEFLLGAFVLISLYFLIIVILHIAIMYYLKTNRYLKIALIVLNYGVAIFFANYYASWILGEEVRRFAINLTNWHDDKYINGNIYFIYLIVIVILVVIFGVIGLSEHFKNKKISK